MRTLSNFAVITALCIPAFGQTKFQLTGDQAAVMSVDEEYRIAKMNNNTATLSRILSTDFYEINQREHQGLRTDDRAVENLSGRVADDRLIRSTYHWRYRRG